ncbi:PREDICTED: deoxynucleotidyltransferase terminal-interacting protein 1 [Nicrophorus vespilloides]|uniref:Deoxynucleotidyltransferase terminal-interacting protein 1 n=1 Tax=Nicrophorus vespilloides TaxID=110193 RepID=A0ABM1ML25_NICVS|nr:PREDICTED: deoxynucleotidyltransferase terminal-interacting protein 1 [Nicrophorus vespilloides]
MIPPLAPGQISEQQNMVGWRNTFNMRHVTLMNMTSSQSRNGVKGYLKSGFITGPAKSLDILRKNLQSSINKDIDNVLKKYLDKFFQPAVNNIRTNLGKESVTDDHIRVVCRQMLEEAKAMYQSCPASRDSSPFDSSDTEIVLDNRINRKNQRKRKESDTDSETSGVNYKRHKFRTTSSQVDGNQVLRLPSKRESPKWDADRITSSTLFMMGSKANKVLGFGPTRGRLYARHPELFRYSGDQEDKDWLTSRNLMQMSGGKAYLVLLDDIREMTQLDEYRNNPNLQIGELVGFEAPIFMLNKIKNFIEQVRTDRKTMATPLDLFDFHSMTPPIDSAPSTPSDTLQMLESHSVSTTSSKHSENNFIHIPDMSPGSTNSLLTQSPLPTNAGLLSPNMLMNIATPDNNGPVMLMPDNSQTGTCLSTLLASQLSSDNSQEF